MTDKGHRSQRTRFSSALASIVAFCKAKLALSQHRRHTATTPKIVLRVLLLLPGSQAGRDFGGSIDFRGKSTC